MKVVTAAQMRSIDQTTIEHHGISADELMLQAGRAVAREAINTFAPARVCVVCGKGNNAGDGFVVARELKSSAIEVSVVCASSPSQLHGPALHAFDRMREAGLTALEMSALDDELRRADLVVDALLGTGIKGPPSGVFSDAIIAINKSRRPVLAVDVPSGVREMQPDEEPGPIVRATMTVTIGLPKTFMLSMPGYEFVGTMVVAPINFPQELLESSELHVNYVTPRELSSWLPPRPDVSHKGTYGSVGIVAGSSVYAGAAIMAARAALRTGCGLVYIFTTAHLNPVYKIALPEAITRIVPSASEDWMDSSSTETILEACQKFQAVAVGPGIGISHEQASLVRRIVEKFERPLLLDADALTAICHPQETNEMFAGEEHRTPAGTPPIHVHVLRGRKNVVLTPHPGEMARMTGRSTKDVQAARLESARAFAMDYGVNLLLKGASTVVAHPDGQAYINPGACSALAKGGSGDVLTGVIASLMAQGVEAGKAALLGSFLHLQAGKRCAEKMGEAGVFSSEIADAIPLVMRDMVREFSTA